MQSNLDQGHLSFARSKFEPVARLLDRLARDIKKHHGRSAMLERSPIEPMAQNAYRVRCALRRPGEVRLSLTFIVVGDEADLMLLQEHEHSGSEDISAHPGRVDQRVYRLDKMDEIKDAVQAKCNAHLRSRGGIA